MVGTTPYFNMQDHEKSNKLKRNSTHFKNYKKGQIADISGLKPFYKGNGTVYTERSEDEISFERGDSPIERINISEEF